MKAKRTDNIGADLLVQTHQSDTVQVNKSVTYTLIKLPPLPSGDEALAVGVPRHTGQTVFMGLGHFGPQLPRLLIEGIVRDSGKNRRGEKYGGGRETARKNIK